MSKTDLTKTDLTKTEITLHWIVAIGMLCMIAMGLYMVNADAFSLMPVHKSVGIALFGFILWRAAVRLRRGWPANISKGGAWEHGLAILVHWGLIIGALLMPLSGLSLSLAGGRGLEVFGLELITPNLDGNGEPQAINKGLATLSELLHGIGANVLIAAIVLHVAGALKHHLIDRDGTLKRMLGYSEN